MKSSLALLLSLFAATLCAETPLGVFEGHNDVGTVLHEGSAEYDAAKRTYTVAGSGENMWFASDAFQFVWRKVTDDVTIAADIAILGEGGDPHRKAVLMFRQSLDAGSAYADAALHGDGLTSLQSRDQQGATTHEIQSHVTHPLRLRLTKRGDYVYMSVGLQGRPMELSGGWMRVPLTGTYYVGIGVCAHNKDRVEKAQFSNVVVAKMPSGFNARQYSTVETVTVASTDRRAAFTALGRIESATLLPDGDVLFVRGEHLNRLATATATAEPLDAGGGLRCTAIHGVSRDGKSVLTTCINLAGMPASYLLPLAGGAAKQIGPDGATAFSESADGRALVFSQRRGPNSMIGIVEIESGKMSTLPGSGNLNEAPEYSPDGEWIYFQSNRSGSVQIWRMHADGSGAEQVTSGEESHWMPHVSPDGKTLAFLSGPVSRDGVPEDKPIALTTMTLADGKTKKVADLVGGRGTLESPSWSADSKRLAFVSYQFLSE